jgi:hypothetical protein
MHGDFVIAPLSDSAAFTALSYTLANEDGDNSRSMAIFGGGHRGFFRVTENCMAALRGVRPRDRDVLVWADAICI